MLIKKAYRRSYEESITDPEDAGSNKKCAYWGLFALEDIPAGAYVTQYLGEVISKRLGDIRGTYYDKIGSSYLFDMNDPLREEEFYER